MRQRNKRQIVVIGVLLLCAIAVVGIPATIFAALAPTEPEVEQVKVEEKEPVPLPAFRQKSSFSSKPYVKEEEHKEPEPEPVETQEGTDEGKYEYAVPEAITEAVPSQEPDAGVETVAPTEGNIFWLGDSVSYLSKQEIQRQFPNAEINAVSGRTLEEGLPALQEKAGTNWSPEAVVIELGANTVAEKPEFRAQYENLLALIPPEVPVFAVTVKVAGTYHNMHNECIKEIAADYANVHVVDWYQAAIENESWLSDGCHPTYPVGVEHFVSVVQQGINEVMGSTE